MSRLTRLFITGSVLFLCIGITLALGALSVYFEDIIHADIAKGINSDNLIFYFQTTRVLAILFLVFSLLSGFAFGFRISASIRKEPTDTTQKINSAKNSHIHVMNFDPYSIPRKTFNQTIANSQPSFSESNNRTQPKNMLKHNFICHECEKQIYNPYICKICHNNFCGEHILKGDHICASN